MRILLRTVLLVIAFQHSLWAETQDSLPRMSNGFAISALGTSALFGLTYDRILQRRIQVEVGVGLIGFGGGLSIFTKKVKVVRICPYAGIKYNGHTGPDFGFKHIFYFPIGVSYFFRSSIFISGDVGPANIRWDLRSARGHNYGDKRYEKSHGFFGNLKIGLRF